MALAAGTRLGPYEIRSALGAGGMGEVYKAVDTRLDRTVAIKVLAPHVAADPELRHRFEREARTISSLNHPHICTLHDVGHQDNTHYLVMEYVEGETLATRLERGPLPIDQALRYAVEIADALGKAHRQGITHRDLKPANIMITKSGTKLLDFGLAKPAARDGGALDVTRPQALSPAPTAHGTILGTLQYMAPEQLEGGEADARSDIFACGAVLYEMVTGRKAFEGKSQASVIAAILERDAPAVSSQQPIAPHALDRIVAKCLAKDPDDRWQSAHDLADELTWIRKSDGQEASSSVAQYATRGRSTHVLAVAAITGLLAAAVGAGVTWAIGSARRAPPADPRVLRFLIETPAVSLASTRLAVVRTLTQGLGQPSLAVSPDGRRIVFVALQDGIARLHVRSFDDTTARPIAGTEGAEGPFFSPDGERVGFFSEGALKVVSLRGGAPLTLAPTSGAGRGGTWSSDGYVYYARTTEGGLSRVRDSGGSPEAVSRLDVAAEVRSHRWPHALPGGRGVLVTVSRATDATFDQARIAVLTPGNGDIRELVDGGSFATYAATGHLVYSRGGALLAVPFDLETLTVTGTAATVLDGVVTDPITGAAHYALSSDGMLAYVAGDVLSYDRNLVWVDRAGHESPVAVESRPYQDVRLSPDGRRVATSIDGATASLWIHDFARGSLSRQTLRWSNNYPVWSDDGTMLYFGRGGEPSLQRQPVDGGGPPEPFLGSGQGGRRPMGVAPDGAVLFVEERPDTRTDVWIGQEGREPTAVAAGPFVEDWPRFSPDGMRVAYVSNESGRDEVYVQARAGGAKVQISQGGGTQPVWARNGREIFYRQELTTLAVNVTSVSPFEVSRPQRLFEGRYLPRYDVAADGRLLMIKEPARALEHAITIVTSWFSELEHLAPRRQ